MMSLDQAISMEPISEKLRNLKQYMPNQFNAVYKFGEFLAGRLNPQLVPQGFALAAELVLYDLQKGVDGFSGQPIRSSLVGHSAQVYALLSMAVPDIAKAVCPEDFARGVREFQEQVNAQMRKEAK